MLLLGGSTQVLVQSSRVSTKEICSICLMILAGCCLMLLGEGTQDLLILSLGIIIAWPGRC